MNEIGIKSVMTEKGTRPPPMDEACTVRMFDFSISHSGAVTTLEQDRKGINTTAHGGRDFPTFNDARWMAEVFGAEEDRDMRLYDLMIDASYLIYREWRFSDIRFSYSCGRLYLAIELGGDTRLVMLRRRV